MLQWSLAARAQAVKMNLSRSNLAAIDALRFAIELAASQIKMFFPPHLFYSQPFHQLGFPRF